MQTHNQESPQRLGDEPTRAIQVNSADFHPTINIIGTPPSDELFQAFEKALREYSSAVTSVTRKHGVTTAFGGNVQVEFAASIGEASMAKRYRTQHSEERFQFVFGGIQYTGVLYQKGKDLEILVSVETQELPRSGE